MKSLTSSETFSTGSSREIEARSVRSQSQPSRRRLSGRAALCLAAFISCTAASGESAPPVDWAAKTASDLDVFAEAARGNYIYAVYPDPDEWARTFDRNLAAVRRTLPLVRDAAGYQAVMRYLVATFQDAHVSIQFQMPPIETRWPGFLASFDNGGYRIARSELADIAEGASLTACDGKPVSWWISTIARYEVGLPVELETTRMRAAVRLLADRGSPLRPRPSRCTINGRDVPLGWRPVAAAKLSALTLPLQGHRDGAKVSTRLIGTDGAWVELGYFEPEDAAQAAAFHAAIAAAPSLRDKRFVILDVRGNGGGPYNWFMAYLRGLYGQSFADHYATARLHIRAVHRLSPAAIELDQEDEASETTFKTPADPPYERNDAIDKLEKERALAAHEAFYRTKPLVIPSGGTPPNPVRADVYVLTDYGCASACIGFVDELKRFPGVRQIGLPTSVDSRSGTAVEVKLPSGNATAYFATMTRDGRIRGDNVPQVPSVRFVGDIHDDKAVEAWVLTKVVAKR